jgi:hypothetical protein
MHHRTKTYLSDLVLSCQTVVKKLSKSCQQVVKKCNGAKVKKRIGLEKKKKEEEEEEDN